MTRVRQSPLLLLALFMLFAVFAPLATTAEPQATSTATKQFCAACRDDDDCSKAYFGLEGKFCYDFLANATATAKIPCCCSVSTFVCATPNATTTKCVCDYIPATTSPLTTPAPTTATPEETDSGGVSTVFCVVFILVCVFFVIPATYFYVHCRKKHTKRMLTTMQEVQYQNAMAVLEQHQQLQTNYNNNNNMQYGGQQQQQQQGYAGL